MRILCVRIASGLVAVVALFGSVAWASEADALAISDRIRQRHLPYGTILDPVFAASTSDEIVNYTRCGDSAIWTGHYLAAEAYRYAVTHSAEALSNVHDGIQGIESLLDVTGTDLLARCRFPANSPYAASIRGEESHNGIYTDADSGDQWVGNTSRDQYSGVLFGLSAAYDLVHEADVQNSAEGLITRLVDFLRNNDWNVRMPDGSASTSFLIRPDQQLAFLTIAAHVNPERFASAPELNNPVLSATVPVPIGTEVLSDDSYFKFNLDAINLFGLIRLDTSASHGIYEEAFSLLWKHVDDHENAFFNMINRALYPADTSHDLRTMLLLENWLARPERNPWVDLRGVVASCNQSDQACNPVPVPQRPTTDFLWQRNPFQLEGGGEGTVESAGIDYLLPYWMARYYAVLSSSAVVSAAGGGQRLARESIASFYAPNLAPGSASADSVPLPTDLGQIHVEVEDAQGTVRRAPLFYVSPLQINLEIPLETANGAAMVRVLNDAGNTVASTTTTIFDVAPSVFTLDAAGTAAATQFIGSDGKLYLALYATGVRNRSSLAGVQVTLGGTALPVMYAGPQGQYEGLDQINVEVPATLRGTGVLEMILIVDGQPANPVHVAIQ